MGCMVFIPGEPVREETAVNRALIQRWLGGSRVTCETLDNGDVLCTPKGGHDGRYNAVGSLLSKRDLYGPAVLVGARAADAALLGDGWVGAR